MVRLRSPQVPCRYTREPGGRGTRGEVTKEEERFLSSQADPSQERREGKSRPAAFGMTGVWWDDRERKMASFPVRTGTQKARNSSLQNKSEDGALKGRRYEKPNERV